MSTAKKKAHIMVDEKKLKLDHEIVQTGVDLLHNPVMNKGTAFSEAERDELRLRGLLPPRIFSQEEQVKRVLGNVRRKSSDFEKYLYMTDLQDRNETLFYRVVMDHVEEMMPILYTPTVGQACLEYGNIFRRSRGLFISLQERGRIREVLRNWPHEDVRVIVVTDGERILGLGDLGAQGMGIPVGKLSLYTACAGVAPSACLPITLDVGTNNQSLLNDPLYIGLQQERTRGEVYAAFVDEFMQAVEEVFPDALIQLEDFGNANAFHLLHTYRDKTRIFDDDIQGTASVVLAGLYSALRLTGGKITDQKYLLLGAGEAGIGIGDLIVTAMMDEGLSEQEARERCWFVDSKGLVVKSRTDLVEHKRPYAHDYPQISDFLTAVKSLQPTGIIGVSGQPNTFTRPVVEAMARINQHPVVFALSNPTSKSECTAEEAYAWSEGRAIFASGSPFPNVTFKGRTFVPGQANNAYIFPGVGLGIVASGSTRVTDEMFFAAAKGLAQRVTENDLAVGRVYPPLSDIRKVSAAIAVAVADIAYNRGLASHQRPADLQAHVRAHMYQPEYVEYV